MASALVAMAGLVLAADTPSVGESDLVSVPVSEWYAIGPFGHPELQAMSHKAFRTAPARTDALLTRLMTAASTLYPMDPGNQGVVDLGDTYEGMMTMNADAVALRLGWEEVCLKGAGTYPSSAQLVGGIGVVYFSTWVYVPQNTPAKVAFSGYGVDRAAPQRSRVSVDVWINRYGLRGYNPGPSHVSHPVDLQDVYLRQGWNHVLCRHISVSGEVHNRMEIALSPALADKLRLSRAPPDSTGRLFRFDGSALSPEERERWASNH